MVSTTESRSPAVLLAGAGNSFDCENGVTLQQQGIGKSESAQRKKYAALVLITMALGAAGGMIGFCVVGPAITEHGTAADGLMGASRGHGLGKAMAKAYVADIEDRVDEMNNNELTGMFSTLQNDMCDDSMKPKVMDMLNDPKTKAQLDAMLTNPNFPMEVKYIAEKSLEKGTLGPLKALGKFSGIVPMAGSRAGRSDLAAKTRISQVKAAADGEEPSDMAKMAGAAAVGGLAGVQLFGELPPAFALCLLAAYGSTYSNGVGNALKQVGGFSAKVWSKSKDLNEQYDLLPKAKTVADAGVRIADSVNKEYGVTDKIDQKLLLSQNIDKVKTSVNDKVNDLKSKASKTE